MASLSAELGYNEIVFAGQFQVHNTNIYAVLFVPDGAEFHRAVPFVLETPGCPSLVIEGWEPRPTFGRDDTDYKSDIANLFYENSQEYSVASKSAPLCDVSETEHKPQVVSDSYLNVEVNIPKFVAFPREVVFCSGLCKGAMPCGNRRRLAVGESVVYCHSHLDQAPAIQKGISK
jgi:hypothetical protein